MEQWPERWWVSEAPVPDSIWKLKQKYPSEASIIPHPTSDSSLVYGSLTDENYDSQLIISSTFPRNSANHNNMHIEEHARPVGIFRDQRYWESFMTSSTSSAFSKSDRRHEGDRSKQTFQPRLKVAEVESKLKEAETEIQDEILHHSKESPNVQYLLQKWGLAPNAFTSSNKHSDGYAETISEKQIRSEIETETEDEFLRNLMPSHQAPAQKPVQNASTLVNDVMVKAFIKSKHRSASAKVALLLDNSLQKMREALVPRTVAKSLNERKLPHEDERTLSDNSSENKLFHIHTFLHKHRQPLSNLSTNKQAKDGSSPVNITSTAKQFHSRKENIRDSPYLYGQSKLRSKDNSDTFSISPSSPTLTVSPMTPISKINENREILSSSNKLPSSTKISSAVALQKSSLNWKNNSLVSHHITSAYNEYHSPPHIPTIGALRTTKTLSSESTSPSALSPPNRSPIQVADPARLIQSATKLHCAAIQLRAAHAKLKGAIHELNVN